MAEETSASEIIGFIPAIFYLNILKIIFGKVKCDVRNINPFPFYWWYCQQNINGFNILKKVIKNYFSTFSIIVYQGSYFKNEF